MKIFVVALLSLLTFDSVVRADLPPIITDPQESAWDIIGTLTVVGRSSLSRNAVEDAQHECQKATFLFSSGILDMYGRLPLDIQTKVQQTVFYYRNNLAVKLTPHVFPDQHIEGTCTILVKKTE